MNMRIILCGWLIVSLLLPGLALGAPRLIHVELSYSGSATSYILYQDGVQVCTSTTPNAMDCTVDIGIAPMTFTLTAVDAEGVESPQSAPYVLAPPTPDPDVPGNFIPQAAFTATATSGTAPLPVSFDASGSSDLGGMIMSYHWEFGDGGAGTGELIDYTFSAAGTYAVTLTIVDDDGASAVQTTSITVAALPQEQTPPPPTNQVPVAVISETPPAAGTSLIGFNGSSSTDPDGTIVSYAWNFGDGDTATGVSAQHEFSAAGDYTVILTVTDNQGATSQDQLAVTVVEAPKPPNVLPVAIISASSQQRLMHYTWEYTGTDPALAGFRLYQNSRLACEVANPAAREADCLTHVDNGVVRLWVTSYDQSGVESAPSSALTFDSTGLFPFTGGDAPLAVHFTSGVSADPDGTIASYAWEFGDGSTAEGMETDYLFTAPGDYTVTLTVTDNSGGQTQTTTVVSVASAQPPIAGNASLSTQQDKSVTATLNASDPDGNPLTFRVTKDGSLGTATITNASTGVFTYVPKVGVFGSDTFSFKANDGTSDSNEAVVSIAIQKKNSAPVATNRALNVQEDQLKSATLTATDPDADPLTFSLVSLPTHGAATLVDAATGAFTYKAQTNYNGTDSFTFKASDGSLASATATVTVTVTAVNDAPTTSGTSLSTTEEVTASGKVTGADPDGDTLTYSIVTNGSKGTAVFTNATTGAYTYTPTTNKNGEDSFVYRVSDGALSAEATVMVTIAPVNDAPSAAGVTVLVTEDTKAFGTLAGTDLDGDTLTYSIVSNGSKGKAVITNGATGAFSYTPTANTNGQDSFVYRVRDGVVSAEATVTLTIAAVNDAPTAAPVSVSTKEDVKGWGQLLGADLDGDTLTYSIVTNGSKGKATITDTTTGAFSYNPSANLNGQDTFVYRVSDGQLSAEALVTVTITPVNDAPKAAGVIMSSTAPVGGGDGTAGSPPTGGAPGSVAGLTLTTEEDVKTFGQLVGLDPDGDSLTYSMVTNGSLGRVRITDRTTGAFVYTPLANMNGQDTFVYRVSDGKSSRKATVTVTITPVNDAPKAVIDDVQVARSGSVTIPVLANDSDVDGDPLTLESVKSPTYGKAVIVNGEIVYTANPNFVGVVPVIYTISDGKGGTATGRARVTVVQ